MDGHGVGFQSCHHGHCRHYNHHCHHQLIIVCQPCAECGGKPAGRVRRRAGGGGQEDLPAFIPGGSEETKPVKHNGLLGSVQTPDSLEDSQGLGTPGLPFVCMGTQGPKNPWTPDRLHPGLLSKGGHLSSGTLWSGHQGCQSSWLCSIPSTATLNSKGCQEHEIDKNLPRKLVQERTQILLLVNWRLRIAMWQRSVQMVVSQSFPPTSILTAMVVCSDSEQQQVIDHHGCVFRATATCVRRCPTKTLPKRYVFVNQLIPKHILT